MAVTSPPVRRVLVVDDQRDVADTFAALLEDLGQYVTVAYDGATALVIARDHRPQVAFLDVSMHGMDGAELARRLREEFPPPALTLVAVTGHNPSHAGVLNGEFDRHLLKPVTPDVVAALLNALPDP